jgi:hypothetical protein
MQPYHTISTNERRDMVRRKNAFTFALHLLTNVQPEFLNHAQHWAPQIWQSSEKFLPHVKKLEQMFLDAPSIYEGSELKSARVMYHCSTWEFHFAPSASAD